MKKLLLLFSIMVISISAAMAQGQKVAYIYSEKVFKSMPAYDNAVKELEEYAKTAKITADSKLKEVQAAFNDFKRSENSLSSQSSKMLRDRIIEMESDANSYEEKFFAEGGAMSIKKNELMKPLETKVIDAVNQIAAQKNYDMIFDLSVAKITIFQKETLDLTNEVIALVKQ